MMGASNSKAKKIPKRDLEFLKANTQFTGSQIKKWYRGFMEECPDGHLSKEQFIRVYKEFFPCGDADIFCGHVFRTFDTDNSGTVDFKEFLLAINVTSNGSATQKLEYAFRMYDIDGSGTIEEKEMIKIIEAIYEMLGTFSNSPQAIDQARKRAQIIFDRLDLNKDHLLTLDEFMKGCLSDKEVYNLLTNSRK